MRRKYGDCQRVDGNCTQCSLVTEGRDCRGIPITRLEWARIAAGMGQRQLADAAGIDYHLIQRIERGRGEAGNLAAKNLLAIADALGVDPRILI